MLVILFHLFGGKILRFSDLEKAIPGVTQKMLGQQRRGMEADGIVVRTASSPGTAEGRVQAHRVGQSLCRLSMQL